MSVDVIGRWWCSWYATDDRPTTWPLPSAFVGCWCSGWTADGRATMVAWVEATDELACRTIVEAAYPEFAGQQWRIEPRLHPDPPGDRFPLPRG